MRRPKKAGGDVDVVRGVCHVLVQQSAGNTKFRSGALGEVRVQAA